MSEEIAAAWAAYDATWKAYVAASYILREVLNREHEAAQAASDALFHRDE